MNENKNNDWKTVYMDALCELDEMNLQPKIEAALKSITDRLQQAASNIDAEERRVIEDARVNLDHLKNL